MDLGEKKGWQIHTFVDASKKAYGAVTYIRSYNTLGSPVVQLLCAKSRVSPLKSQTIPRLELCAALLGTQLTTKVRRELQLHNSSTYIWSDSQIVLSWIESASNSLEPFVMNRITKIRELAHNIQWLHIDSKNNPADLISRGMFAAQLWNNSFWFHGPLLLHQANDAWTNYINANKINKPLIVMPIMTDTTTEENVHPVFRINHRNSFQTLQRVTAFILRFCKRTLKKEVNTTASMLSLDELLEAEIVILKATQEENFKDEVKALTHQKELNNSSNLKGLEPFMDDKGLIRVGGRLHTTSLPYDAKHPIILPYNDSITKLILQKIHNQHYHCGTQALLAQVRNRFWPIKGKSMARSIIHNCVRCNKAKPKLFQQIMGNLPPSRIMPARPFINAGVDFCGPFFVHFKIRGKAPRKAYVAIFCCFSTKAVHLELVSDLTTEAFIGCLKRFIARRGHCLNLYCDNATNFTGASKQLSPLEPIIHSPKAKAMIDRICTNKGIQFHFIPPRTPHFGGLWEAAVKAAKYHFVRGVGNASLTYEELETVMVEIEAILNSRPLTPISQDPMDTTALTPGHFLIGEPLTSQTDPRSINSNPSLLTRWNLVSHLKQEFWRRWSTEYLQQLQHRHKWDSQSPNAKPGMLVIIKEDNLPPLEWPLGRIIKCYLGPDNRVRVVDIKTATGVCKRAIHRLSPLPIIKEGDPDLSAAETIKSFYPDTRNSPGPQRKKRKDTNIIA